MDEPRYTRHEFERRFLVRPGAPWMALVEPYSKKLEDKYLSHTRLRLRRQVDSDTGRCVLKLNKKVDTDSPYVQTVSRILLSEEEFGLLDRQAGYRLSKRRYYHTHLGRTYSLDLFAGELEGLVLCETEADSLDALLSIALPDYVDREVTAESFFKGGDLCRTTRAALMAALAGRPQPAMPT